MSGAGAVGVDGWKKWMGEWQYSSCVCYDSAGLSAAGLALVVLLSGGTKGHCHAGWPDFCLAPGLRQDGRLDGRQGGGETRDAGTEQDRKEE